MPRPASTCTDSTARMGSRLAEATWMAVTTGDSSPPAVSWLVTTRPAPGRAMPSSCSTAHGGGRSVGEQMAEVGVAGGTAGLGADHAVAAILDAGDATVGDLAVEARPAGAGVEPGVAVEQLGVAHDTAVDAGVLVVPVLAGERPLGAGLLGDVVLQRRQAAADPVVGRATVGWVRHACVSLRDAARHGRARASSSFGWRWMRGAPAMPR